MLRLQHRQVTWVEKLRNFPWNLNPTLEAPSTAPEMAPKLAVPETTEVAPEMSVDAAPEKGTKGREELTSSSHGDTEIMAILLLESWFWS